MKKLSIVLVTCCFAFIVSCQAKIFSFNFQVPTSQVYIEKDVVLPGDEHIVSACTTDPLVLSSKEDIEQLISYLNLIEYKETEVALDIAMYKYKISLKDNVIAIVDDDYFYFNNDLFILKTGNFDFLDDYSFQVFC